MGAIKSKANLSQGYLDLDIDARDGGGFDDRRGHRHGGGSAQVSVYSTPLRSLAQPSAPEGQGGGWVVVVVRRRTVKGDYGGCCYYERACVCVWGGGGVVGW